MQYFLFDFALALVALLGYRIIVTRQGAVAGLLERTGKLHPPPAAAPRTDIARPRRRVEPQRALPWQEESRRASLHRLINFW
jgi:hypothetical protein